MRETTAAGAAPAARRKSVLRGAFMVTLHELGYLPGTRSIISDSRVAVCRPAPNRPRGDVRQSVLSCLQETQCLRFARDMIMVESARNSNAQGGAHAHSVLLSRLRPVRRARPVRRRHAGIGPAAAAARRDAVAADAQHA